MMKVRLLTLAALMAPAVFPAAASADYVYFSNDHFNTTDYGIQRLDASDGTVDQTWDPTINGNSLQDRTYINGPRHMEFGSDGLLYFATRASKTDGAPRGVTVVDTVTETTTHSLALPANILGVAAGDDYVFATQQNGNVLFRLNRSDLSAAAGNDSGTTFLSNVASAAGESGVGGLGGVETHGDDAYVVYSGGRIYRVESDKTVTRFDNAASFGTGADITAFSDLYITPDGSTMYLGTDNQIIELQGPSGPSAGSFVRIVSTLTDSTSIGGIELTSTGTLLVGVAGKRVVELDLLDGSVLNTYLASGQAPYGIAVIPEPASLALLALGGVCMLGRRRR